VCCVCGEPAVVGWGGGGGGGEITTAGASRCGEQTLQRPAVE